VRSSSEYSTAEWLGGEPLLHGFKLWRNQRISSAFTRRRPADLDKFLSAHAEGVREGVTIAVAFNTPWVIDLLSRAVRLHLRGPLVVVDNSRDPSARPAIERICRDRDIPYVGLPRNPERHPCRSHGIAMNWAYYNLIAAWKPKIFGFIDHDLFPLAELDPAERLAGRAVYGQLNDSPWGWNLWAGYCFFDRRKIEDYLPDFNHDVPRHLDTGGRNWTRIYRHLAAGQYGFAKSEPVPVDAEQDGERLYVHAVDRCIHVGGASFGPTRRIVKDASVMERIIERLEAGERYEAIIRHELPVPA
jgi:hypothetical protein